MAESIRCVLEVYDAPTFSLSTPVHIFGAVIGDTVSFKVLLSAVGAFTDDIDILVNPYPADAIITYSPADGIVGPGEATTINIDTTEMAAGVYDVLIEGQEIA